MVTSYITNTNKPVATTSPAALPVCLSVARYSVTIGESTHNLAVFFSSSNNTVFILVLAGHYLPAAVRVESSLPCPQDSSHYSQEQRPVQINRARRPPRTSFLQHTLTLNPFPSF